MKRIIIPYVYILLILLVVMMIIISAQNLSACEKDNNLQLPVCKENQVTTKEVPCTDKSPTNINSLSDAIIKLGEGAMPK
jgi:hypothetical protein